MTFSMYIRPFSLRTIPEAQEASLDRFTAPLIDRTPQPAGKTASPLVLPGVERREYGSPTKTHDFTACYNTFRDSTMKTMSPQTALHKGLGAGYVSGNKNIYTAGRPPTFIGHQVVTPSLYSSHPQARNSQAQGLRSSQNIFTMNRNKLSSATPIFPYSTCRTFVVPNSCPVPSSCPATSHFDLSSPLSNRYYSATPNVCSSSIISRGPAAVQSSRIVTPRSLVRVSTSPGTPSRTSPATPPRTSPGTPPRTSPRTPSRTPPRTQCPPMGKFPGQRQVSVKYSVGTNRPGPESDVSNPADTSNLFNDDSLAFHDFPLPCAFLKLPWPASLPYVRLVPQKPTRQQEDSRFIVDNSTHYRNNYAEEAHTLIVKRMCVERVANDPSVYVIRYLNSPMGWRPGKQENRLNDDGLFHSIYQRSHKLFPSSSLMGIGFSTEPTWTQHVVTSGTRRGAPRSGKEKSLFDSKNTEESTVSSSDQESSDDAEEVCIIYFRLKIEDLPYSRKRFEEDWRQRRNQINRTAAALVVVYDFRFSGLLTEPVSHIPPQQEGAVGQSPNTKRHDVHALSPLPTSPLRMTAENNLSKSQAKRTASGRPFGLPGPRVSRWTPDCMRKVVHLTAQTQSIVDAQLGQSLKGRELILIHLVPPSFNELIDAVVIRTNGGIRSPLLSTYESPRTGLLDASVLLNAPANLSRWSEGKANTITGPIAENPPEKVVRQVNVVDGENEVSPTKFVKAKFYQSCCSGVDLTGSEREKLAVSYKTDQSNSPHSDKESQHDDQAYPHYGGRPSHRMGKLHRRRSKRLGENCYRRDYTSASSRPSDSELSTRDISRKKRFSRSGLSPAASLQVQPMRMPNKRGLSSHQDRYFPKVPHTSALVSAHEQIVSSWGGAAMETEHDEVSPAALQQAVRVILEEMRKASLGPAKKDQDRSSAFLKSLLCKSCYIKNPSSSGSVNGVPDNTGTATSHLLDPHLYKDSLLQKTDRFLATSGDITPYNSERQSSSPGTNRHRANHGSGAVDCKRGSGTVDCKRDSGTADCKRGSGIVDCKSGSGIVDCERGSGAVDCKRGSGTVDCKCSSGIGPATVRRSQIENRQNKAASADFVQMERIWNEILDSPHKNQNLSVAKNPSVEENVSSGTLLYEVKPPPSHKSNSWSSMSNSVNTVPRSQKVQLTDNAPCAPIPHRSRHGATAEQSIGLSSFEAIARGLLPSGNILGPKKLERKPLEPKSPKNWHKKALEVEKRRKQRESEVPKPTVATGVTASPHEEKQKLMEDKLSQKAVISVEKSGNSQRGVRIRRSRLRPTAVSLARQRGVHQSGSTYPLNEISDLLLMKQYLAETSKKTHSGRTGNCVSSRSSASSTLSFKGSKHIAMPHPTCNNTKHADSVAQTSSGDNYRSCIPSPLLSQRKIVPKTAVSPPHQCEILESSALEFSDQGLLSDGV